MRIEYADDDDLVAGLITAARLVCEKELHRAFVSQIWETYLDHWPWPSQYPGPMYLGSAYIPQTFSFPYTPFSMIQIDNPDLVSVASITYIDTSGAVQTLDPAAYQIEPAHQAASTPPTARPGRRCDPYPTPSR